MASLDPKETSVDSVDPVESLQSLAISQLDPSILQSIYKQMVDEFMQRHKDKYNELPVAVAFKITQPLLLIDPQLIVQKITHNRTNPDSKFNFEEFNPTSDKVDPIIEKILNEKDYKKITKYVDSYDELKDAFYNNIKNHKTRNTFPTHNKNMKPLSLVDKKYKEQSIRDYNTNIKTLQMQLNNFDKKPYLKNPERIKEIRQESDMLCREYPYIYEGKTFYEMFPYNIESKDSYIYGGKQKTRKQKTRK